MTKLSVIICTHNLHGDYLAQTLGSLRDQSLPHSDWELLLVDNASPNPVAGRFPLDWHPQGRHLTEPKLGQTHAFLQGIRESEGDLIVMVDDDNVLAPDYLEQAQRIAHEWPKLGTWGGSVIARYEEAPPSWLKPYERYLSVRAITNDLWFNMTRPDLYGSLPYGAGMCVRRNVADEYLHLLETDEVRRQLGRKGDSLVSSADTDLALLGCDLGLGTGLFASLKLTHLIHKGRLTQPYIERILREMTYSLRILAAKRGHMVSSSSWLRRSWEGVAAWRRGKREFKFHRATLIGVRAADAEIKKWRSGNRS